MVVEGGAGCIDREGLGQQIHMWLERDHLDGALRIELDVSSRGGQTGARLVLRRHGRLLAERSFSTLPDDCGTAQAALSLAIALAIDATLIDQLTTPTARDPRPRHSVSMEGMALAGVLGRPAAAARLGMARRWTPVLASRLGLMATTGHLLSVGEGAAEVDLLAVQATLCASYPRGRLEAAGCGGLAAGLVRAEGVGFPRTSTARMGWLAPTARMEVAYQILRPAWLILGVELMTTISRPRLQVLDGGGDVIARRSLPSLGAGLSLGLSWTFE
jgi:hypothetical protein